jgi:hypothetical protein
MIKKRFNPLPNQGFVVNLGIKTGIFAKNWGDPTQPSPWQGEGYEQPKLEKFIS